MSKLTYNAGFWISLKIIFGLLTLPALLSYEKGYLGISNSIFTVIIPLIILLGIYGFRKRNEQNLRILQRSDKAAFLPYGIGFFYAACLVIGKQLEVYGEIRAKNIYALFALLIWSVIFGDLISYSYKILRERKTQSGGNSCKECTVLEIQSVNRKNVILRSLIIFLLYFLILLAVYPGFFVYDAQEEYIEVITRNFTTHHPLFHVLLMGGGIHFFEKVLGSVNAGIFLYLAFQSLLLSFIFGFISEVAGSFFSLRKWEKLVLTLYFGICPPIVMFSLCSAKDGLFMGALSILVLLLFDMIRNQRKYWEDENHIKRLFLVGTLLVLLMLLRHNAFYAILVSIPFFAIGMKKYGKKIGLFFLLLLITYLFLNKALTWGLKADHSEHQEMLTVPIMQMARVYAFDHDSLNEDEKSSLEHFLPKEALYRYTPKVSDGVKVDFNNEYYDSHKKEFWNLYIKVFVSHPIAYINGALMTSYGFWYPDAIIDVYRGNTVFTYTYADSSYFGFETEEPGIRNSKIPVLEELYRNISLEIFQQKIPVVSMLFSPGFMFFVFVYLGGFIFYKSEIRKEGLVLVIPLMILLTYLLGPTYLVRYVIWLWILVPLLLIRVIKGD